MIVGGYTLDLYCNTTNPKHEYNEFPHQFYAETGSECRAAARRAGWKLDLKTGKAWCPKCERPKEAPK